MSHTADLAIKHALDFRAVIESDWYRRMFPSVRISRNAGMDFVTTAQGGRFSTSVDGPLTGRGGNLIIIDDPVKAEDANSEVRRTRVNDWFDGTLYTRLDDKRNGVIAIIMQRLHVDDLVGHILGHA